MSGDERSQAFVRRLRAAHEEGRQSVLRASAPDDAAPKIPLSHEEQVALLTLRLLVAWGVVGPEAER